MKARRIRPDRIHVRVTGIYDENSTAYCGDRALEHVPFYKSYGSCNGVGSWEIEINPNTGEILGWPNDVRAMIFYKVCDRCRVTLYKDCGELMPQQYVRHDPYVPDILCPSESGYGDYIIMSIDEDGKIKNWENDYIYTEHEYYPVGIELVDVRDD